jgi:hypothetical protein
MIIGQIGMQPYLNLPLQNSSVDDISPTPKSPSNTGVASSTGIFGQSNGAYEWDSAGDKLTWASSIANAVADIMNDKCTILFYLNGVSLSLSQYRYIFNQSSPAGGSRSFALLSQNYSGNLNRLSLDNYNTGGGYVVHTNASSYVSSTWQFYTFTTKHNGTNLTYKSYLDSVLQQTTSGVTFINTATQPLSIGAGDNNTVGNFGKMVGFKLYPADLNSLQTQIINAQLGRIAA